MVVLDEFPYLCEADPGLPSRIQRFWDHQGQQSNLMLALSGSAVSFMEKAKLMGKFFKIMRDFTWSKFPWKKELFCEPPPRRVLN